MHVFIVISAGSGSKFAGFGSGIGMRVSGSCGYYPSAMGRVIGFFGSGNLRKF